MKYVLLPIPEGKRPDGELFDFNLIVPIVDPYEVYRISVRYEWTSRAVDSEYDHYQIKPDRRRYRNRYKVGFARRLTLTHDGKAFILPIRNHADEIGITVEAGWYSGPIRRFFGWTDGIKYQSLRRHFNVYHRRSDVPQYERSNPNNYWVLGETPESVLEVKASRTAG